MKELTGGDPITARALYSEAETFTPQFCLVVCTNNLPEIGSNDDGTWRRIRICDFVSKFVDADVVPNQESCGDDEEKKYVFPKDKKLKIKIPMWAPVFMSMLVKRVFDTKGHVEDCEMVLSSSNKYRRGQDHISAFVIEMVGKKEGKKIGKQELTEQFKLWFQTQQGSRILPKGCGEELSLYMDKKFGKKRKDGWYGVEILYADATDEIQELAS
jgi:phage/plasmid-associated DNA primase